MRLLARAAIWGLEETRVAPIRTFLSLLTLIVGMVALVAVEASVSATGHANSGYVEMVAGRPATYRLSLGGLPVDEADEVTRRLGIIADDRGWDLVTTHTAPGRLVIGDANVEMVFTTISGAPENVRVSGMVAGRMLTEFDTKSMACRVVVSEEIASNLGLVGPLPVTVLRSSGTSIVSAGEMIGIVGRGSYGDIVASPSCLIGEARLDSTPAEAFIRLKPADAAVLESAHGVLTEGVTVGAPEFSRIDTGASFAPIIQGTGIVMRSIAIVAASLAALGLLNLRLLSTSIRRPDFALLRALGWTRSEISVAVMAETMAIVVIAATVAVIGVWAVTRWRLSWLIRLPPEVPRPDHLPFPVEAAVMAVGASLVISLIAGFVPAWRAASAQPAEVMRE